MKESTPLLQDEAMRDFIRRGYTLVQADLEADFHREVRERLDGVIGKEGNPGNNILPRVPQIQRVFDSAPVRGALQSLLGPGYTIHPHRYCHLNTPDSKGQNWHKDDYIFDQQTRHHRGRWLMAFYYPQDVTADMGPTGVMPGRQHCNTLSSADPDESVEEEFKLCGPAGTVALVNFDVWHRATANTSKRPRYMLKFQFVRMAEPQGASWDSRGGAWGHGEDGLGRHVWDWMGGTGAEESGGDVEELLGELKHEDEARRLRAVYGLGACGSEAVPGLMDALQAQAEGEAEARLAKTPANVHGGNPADLEAAHALAAVGPAAVDDLAGALGHGHWGVRAAAADILGTVGTEAAAAAPRLTGALADENFWVRRNAAQALGTIAPQDGDAAEALGKSLGDGDERVRRNAALALAKIGPAAAEAVEDLKPALADENRYVRYNAMLALRRIGTAQAQEALWDDLLASRWCPVTTAETPY